MSQGEARVWPYGYVRAVTTGGNYWVVSKLAELTNHPTAVLQITWKAVALDEDHAYTLAWEHHLELPLSRPVFVWTPG